MSPEPRKNEAIASRYNWPQRLLGSLKGQLQLATHLVVFLGFTGASSVGLLIDQRNLLANDQLLVRQSIALCDKAITDLQDDPASPEQELLFHSSPNTTLWIENNKGDLVHPRIHQYLSDAAILTAGFMTSTNTTTGLSTQTIKEENLS
ncbi:hypothetical protein [Synechococcus sp. MU1642]|uniref:hypothetical protein n=1 Tax=Synechococcus sp. MU1642 TaxID=2508348 RepID=UPI001CF82671|nr:hypothetical protein [Synechococcus sp. MU1642]MCB4407177.1 hypothetical protein [Synechococcus sp. MU1642]